MVTSTVLGRIKVYPVVKDIVPGVGTSFPVSPEPRSRNGLVKASVLVVKKVVPDTVRLPDTV